MEYKQVTQTAKMKLFLLSALQFFVSFGLLNYFFPLLPLLRPLFPIGHPHLPQVIPHIVLPSCSWSSLRSCCIRFPFVYGLGRSFIGHSFTNQHYPIQNRSLGKPHTTGDVAPTPGSSAGILYVEVPSAALSRPFWVLVRSSKMANFDMEFEFGEKEKVTRTQIRQVWKLRNHWNTLFGQKYVHGDGIASVSDAVMQYSNVRNLWPDTIDPLISGRTRWTP